MKLKVIFSSIALFMTLSNAANINNVKEANKILDYYAKHGIKNKSDFEKYKKAFNIKYKNSENKILDNRTKIKKFEITKNNIMLIIKESYNKKAMLKDMKDVLGFIPDSPRIIKKYEDFNDVSLMYKDAAPICKELANIGYFKYGKFKEIIKDKIYNKDFHLEATSPKDCSELEKRKNIIWNAYVKFAERLISIYQ